ncbi:hypothetical protein H5410_025454 [Solanum commersonii]|uniref:Uncharacterized protein n=1 Tax=Solanum commersonii TaxID=4109 RepID=A0A9J5YU99_SOLCO|nr:hypothetical protein H5410_025454 [Solanum commersonii]
MHFKDAITLILFPAGEGNMVGKGEGEGKKMIVKLDRIGCILLSAGQDDFHGEALDTLKYVIFLPSDVKDDIDCLNGDLTSAADNLKEETNENSGKIRRVFNAVRSALITVAVVMLLISILGLSILGHQHSIHIVIKELKKALNIR